MGEIYFNSLVRKDMDVNEHERLFNITLRQENSFQSISHCGVYLQASKNDKHISQDIIIFVDKENSPLLSYSWFNYFIEWWLCTTKHNFWKKKVSSIPKFKITTL